MNALDFGILDTRGTMSSPVLILGFIIKTQHSTCLHRSTTYIIPLNWVVPPSIVVVL